jgi:ketosteroid isomerase-like protein
MSSENVETVRVGYEAFRRGDLEGVGKVFADDVEWESPDSLPNGGVYRGRGAVLRSFAEIPKYWTTFSVDPDEYIDAGDDHVVVRGIQHLTGPGGSTESRYLHLFTLRNGKVVRGEFMGDSAKARDTISASPHESVSQTFKKGE